MARNVLILGGTKFFGKELVYRLLQNNDRVVIASRNLSKKDFDSMVGRIVIERENPQSITDAIGDREFDLVYDQICYAPTAAADLCKVLKGRTKRLIFTSTQSIYSSNDCQRESDFDAMTYAIKMGDRSDFDYAEGKRQAEAVYAQKASFPVTAVRLPFVLGEHDYLKRLEFHVDRIKETKPIAIANLEARISMIHAKEAAEFLFWLGTQKIDGPINACSAGEITLGQLVKMIENIADKKAVLKKKGFDSETSPYNQPYSRYMDTHKAEKLGFSFSNVEDWLPALIKKML